MKKRSVIWTYLLSYLLVLIIPLTVPVLFFTIQMCNYIAENTKIKYNNQLTAAASYMETMLTAIESTQYSIENSSWIWDMYIKRVLQDEDPSPSEQNRIVRELVYFCAQNHGMINVSIQFQGDNIVYTAGTFYDPGFDYNYKNYIKRVGIKYCFFPVDLTGSPFELISSDVYPEDFLIYRAPISAGKSSSYQAKCADLNIVFSTHTLLSHCQNSIENGTVFSILFDGKDSMQISTQQLNSAIKYVDLTSLSKTSEGVAYRLYIPEQQYYKPIRSLTSTTIFLLGLVFVISMTLAFQLARANVRPIRTIIENFPTRKREHINELSWISQEIEQLINRCDETEQALGEIQAVTHQQALIKLLYYSSSETNLEYLQQNNIVFTMPLYAVIVVYLSVTKRFQDPEYGKNSISRLMTIISDACEYYKERNNVNSYVCELMPDRYAFIANFKKEIDFQQFVHELTQDITANILDSCDISVYFGVGNVYSQLSSLHLSFNEASIALENMIFSKGRYLCHYSDCVQNKRSFYDYSLAEESSLIAELKIGNSKSACNQILDIIKRNKKNGILHNSYSSKCLCYHILLTVVKSMRQVGVKVTDYVDLVAFGRLADFDSMLQYILDIVCSVCDKLHQTPDFSDVDFNERLITYIEDHLFQSDLSLKMMSAHFGVSMAYISQTFKENYGRTYSEYVNYSRITHAKELMSSGKYNWTQISALVGYNSVNTFRRNFVKYTGTTPTSYSETPIIESMQA